MNLREIILEEHSKKQAMRIVRWVGTDKKRFAGLVKLFLHGEYRVTQRISWPLSIIAESHPELVRPYLGKLIAHINVPGLHVAVARNTMRFLQFIDIPKRYQGKLVDICFGFLLKSDSPIALRVFSMTVLQRIAVEEPELVREIREAVKSVMSEGGGAIIARGKMVLKKLDPIEANRNARNDD
jgi:hypothetical protein